ncbi:putative dehydrogenase [Frondihabitans sp. PhB188]|uniref:Gfo/Idh/MocA family protein n=1 Tax=Frondihabitans sp. PhB188 TaxID=2485200 RepID=UPI000FB59ED1|nr:Gfo/Idh/MocA family oxidoreductase [Frondihabitans sp. PhB188]ROQ41492.1 putative dehydrogenase [Frondihabitans sp. PhB188]
MTTASEGVPVDRGTPLRVVLVGAGLMGRNWLEALRHSADARVVGIVDLDLDLARSAAGEYGVDVVGTSVADVAAAASAEAVINVTVPRAHLPVTTEALDAGLPVLCEKPIAPTVAEALLTAAAAEASGRLVMTSQNRRYYNSLAAFRGAIDEIGETALLTTEYAKEAHFPGFRETMAHPLLVDMAIHAFDVARYLLRSNPVSVWCETYNPAWSWFDGDSVATATFEFEGGTRYRYTGSWTTRGMDTSWNGVWRAGGSHGTATWDGERGVDIERADPSASVPGTGASVVTSSGLLEPIRDDAPEEVAGALADFVDAVRTGRTPESEVHANVLSLAMVEAAVRSADTGVRVRIADVLDDAYATALDLPAPPAVHDALLAWGSASVGLHLFHPVDA